MIDRLQEIKSRELQTVRRKLERLCKDLKAEVGELLGCYGHNTEEYKIGERINSLIDAALEGETTSHDPR